MGILTSILQEETSIDEPFKLLQKQVNEEFYAAYLYLEISNIFASKDLKGFSNFFKAHFYEEIGHAMIINQFLLEHGYTPVLESIKKPELNKDLKPIELLLEAFNHEKYITSCIDNIAKAFVEQHDVINWFIKEQEEEESLFKNIIADINEGRATIEELDAKFFDRKIDISKSTPRIRWEQINN